MNTASKSVVAQDWAKRSVDLRAMLPRARKLFFGTVSHDPQDVHLRQLDDGMCEVICFPDDKQAKRLAVKSLLRDADGVVVVASAANWPTLLGLKPDAD